MSPEPPPNSNSGRDIPVGRDPAGKPLGHRGHRATAGYAILAGVHLVESAKKVGWHSGPMTSSQPSDRGYRVPAASCHAVWLCHCFGLRVRAVDDLHADRGVIVTDEMNRQWCPTCGIDDARRLRRRRGRMGDTWYLDERFVKIQGRQQYECRAVDADGGGINILVQSWRSRRAASRFFRKLVNGQGREPHRPFTDQFRSYAAAHRIATSSVLHRTWQSENNRAERSHSPTRQRERQMRRFKSAAHLQRFASVHGVVQNLFRVGRHLLRTVHHRLLRTQAFVAWDAAHAGAPRRRREPRRFRQLDSSHPMTLNIPASDPGEFAVRGRILYATPGQVCRRRANNKSRCSGQRGFGRVSYQS